MDTRNENYLKTQQVARALGVSVSTIKRWVDSGALQATRTLGKHRLIPRDEAARFAREQGLRFDEAGVAESVPVAALQGEAVEPLTSALRRGRQVEARQLILQTHAGAGTVTMADELIRPAMEQIGREWESRAIDIFQEHRATRIVKLVLWELIQQASQTTPEGGRDALLALGACPEGDPYSLPGLLCELALRELGWDVMNLGLDLPLASLARAVQAHRPDLVWLSVSYIEDPALFLREYTSFYQTTAATGAAVVVGGRALAPELRARMVAASFGDRIAHLAEFARRLRSDVAAPKDRNRTVVPQPPFGGSNP